MSGTGLGLPALADIERAREAIAPWAVRTPLVRFDPLAPPGGAGGGAPLGEASPEEPASFGAEGVEVYLKLENLQPIGAFKIRGAASAMAAAAPTSRLDRGVVTASAGNMAQGVAWLARELGVSCTVLVPDFAPETKIVAIERLGASVMRVSYEQWWEAFQTRMHPGVPGLFIHAFDDPHVMAGNGTIALEILEELPDVDAVITPWGGGGLTCGVAAAMQAARPQCRVYVAEVEGAAPLSASLAAGSPQVIEYHPSFVDGIGSKSVFPAMLERAKGLVAGALTASVDDTAEMLLALLERNHVLAEGAGACPVACALRPASVVSAPSKPAHEAAAPASSAASGPRGKVVCVVSGGNIDLLEVAELASQCAR